MQLFPINLVFYIYGILYTDVTKSEIILHQC